MRLCAHLGPRRDHLRGPLPGQPLQPHRQHGRRLDGAASFIDDHTDKPTSIFARSYLWSPAADVLAVILETKNSDDTTVNSVYFYDVARSQKTAETTPVSKYDLMGMAWSADGQGFFITFGTTIYRVDAATGEFAPVFTTDTPGTGLAVIP